MLRITTYFEREAAAGCGETVGTQGFRPVLKSCPAQGDRGGGYDYYSVFTSSSMKSQGNLSLGQERTKRTSLHRSEGWNRRKVPSDVLPARRGSRRALSSSCLDRAGKCQGLLGQTPSPLQRRPFPSGPPSVALPPKGSRNQASLCPPLKVQSLEGGRGSALGPTLRTGSKSYNPGMSAFPCLYCLTDGRFSRLTVVRKWSLDVVNKAWVPHHYTPW